MKILVLEPPAARPPHGRDSVRLARGSVRRSKPSSGLSDPHELPVFLRNLEPASGREPLVH